MKFVVLLPLLIIGILHTSCAPTQDDSLRHADEAHLKNIRQLTFGGENAEAYLSFAGDRLVFQSSRDSFDCDQIFTMDLEGADVQLVSTGLGRTTCAYFLPGDSLILYSSTHMDADSCPPTPDFSQGYVWPIYDAYNIYTVGVSGENNRILSASEGYDAEATVSPTGDRIVFTSTRDGDLDIYSMNTDGSDIVRLTNEIGYDGGAFYSADGRKIVYRANHPQDSTAIAEYQHLLSQGLIKPSVMELFIMNADGSGKKQITHFGVASFAPYFHPDGERIIFSSNLKDPKGRNFDLFSIKTDGTDLQQVTFNDTFDGFPVFTPDGEKLIFASNRNAKERGETNVFIADWVQ
jgi:Tol biopolymer transport system component